MATFSNELLQQFDFLGDRQLQEELLANGELVCFNKGDVVVREGQYVKFLPIVLSGAIRVYQRKDEREMLLYYVMPSQTCTMSLSAAYFENKSSSFGMAVDATEALVFPAHLIQQWQQKFPSWNQYVMQMFRARYDELIRNFEKAVFENIDVRLMDYLHHKRSMEQNATISISHQVLANELGTTRVVVSRILKQFEKEQKLRLSRGAIQLLQ
ncbi:MAG: Crp/Fnr family transcriptional regulator [Flavisolibacter sp.]